MARLTPEQCFQITESVYQNNGSARQTYLVVTFCDVYNNKPHFCLKASEDNLQKILLVTLNMRLEPCVHTLGVKYAADLGCAWLCALYAWRLHG